MFSTYELLLLKRFLFSKKTDGYISIFTWFSIIGIMIGVAAIIIVMSVMNGFREEITSRILGINGHINIYSTTEEINWESIEYLKNSENTSYFFLPLIETQALLITKENSQGVYIRSYEEEDIKKKKFIKNKIVRGKIYSKESNEIIVGYALANKLNLKINDEVKIAIPKSDKTIFGNIPRFKTLKISGIFNIGMFEYDFNFIFSDPSITRKLLLLKEDSFNQIEIEAKNPDNVDEIQKKINQQFKIINNNLNSISWKQSNSSLINALNVEKNVMFLILTLIILVASMNIISGLIIFVKEKNKDIGILKMIGVSDISLIKIFVSVGLIIGLIGTLLGAILGVLFSLNIQLIQRFIENLFNINLFSKEVYYLTSLPSKLDFFEVFFVIIISLIISLFSTIFPALRSSKINPITTIKND